MPQSLQYVLDHANELAKRFEAHEPDLTAVQDARPLRRVQEAVQARAVAERALIEAVAAARQAGLSWAVISLSLGMSGEAARKRYGELIRTSDTPPGADAPPLS